MLSKYTWKFRLVYLENIIFLSKINDQQLKDFEDILATLYAAGVRWKLKKCDWFKTKVEYLRHTITPHRLSTTEMQTKSLKGMKHPRTLTELRSFFVCRLSTGALSSTILAYRTR